MNRDLAEIQKLAGVPVQTRFQRLIQASGIQGVYDYSNNYVNYLHIVALINFVCIIGLFQKESDRRRIK